MKEVSRMSETVKLIIEIPKTIYEDLKAGKIYDSLCEAPQGLVEGIRDGIPLDSNKGDLISRQVVLDELKKWDWQDLYLPSHFKQLLDDIPFVENKGKWIPIDDFPHEVWECDHCGFVIDGSGCIEPTEYRDVYNFCPNCGADMREPKGEKGTGCTSTHNVLKR